MKRYFLLLMFVFCFIPFTLFGKETYNVSFISGKIKLDGKLDEDVWTKIKPIDNFYLLGTGKEAPYKTEAKIGISEDSLYLGVICYEDEMDKIKASHSDGGNLWDEDSIEFFIYPEGLSRYFQFIVNAVGARFNFQIEGFPSLNDWQAKAYKGDKYWSIEVRIPFEVLGRYPEGVWTGNICRNRCVSGRHEYYTWAKILGGGFHQPEMFNELVFEKNNEIASKQMRKKIQNKIKELEKTYILKSGKKEYKKISIDQEITVSDAYQILNMLYKFEDKISKESEQISEQLKKLLEYSRTRPKEEAYIKLQSTFF